MTEGSNAGDMECNDGSGNSNWEMRERMQVRIKIITIFWEGRGDECSTFGFYVDCSASSWRYCCFCCWE